jgi:hypothetical protein
MADTKISGLTAGTPNAADVLPYADLTASQTKKTTLAACALGWQLLEEHTVAGAATLDFKTRNVLGQSSNTFQSDFDDYIIELLNFVPATTSVDLYMRFSTDGGSTFDSSSLYASSAMAWTSGGTGNGGNALGALAGQLTMRGTAEIANTAAYGVCATIRIFNPLSTTFNKRISVSGSYPNNASAYAGVEMRGTYVSLVAANAFRFLFSSGNGSGTGRCYGVRL